jgi:hypothetical protein
MEDVSQETQEKETQPEAEEVVEKAPSTPIIDAAKAENDRKAELLKQEEELLTRREKIMANKALGGLTEAGNGAEEKLDPKDFAKKLEQGEIPMDEFLSVKK